MKAKRPFKVNKFIFLVILGSLGVLSMGASSWLIINEQSGSPSFQSKNLVTASITISGTAYEGMSGLKITSNVAGTLYHGDTPLVTVSNAAATSQTPVDIPNAPSNIHGTVTNQFLSAAFTFDLSDEWEKENEITEESKSKLSFTQKEVIRAVVYNGSSTYYSSINHALDTATSGSLYILESYATYKEYAGASKTLDNYKTLQPLTVTATREVKSGVKLVVPYDNTINKSNPYSINTGTSDSVTGKVDKSISTFCHAYETPESFLKYHISLGANSTLINRGTIVTEGVLHAGNGGWKNASLTWGSYGQITLRQNATIQNYKSIQNYGYIFELDKNNSSQIINEDGAEILTPFTIYEHRGGSALTSLGGWTMNDLKSCPFNRFYVGNISSKVIVKHGSFLHGAAFIGIQGEPAESVVKLVGNSDSYFANIFSDTKLIMKFDLASKVSTWEILGSANINTLSVKMKYLITNLDINTDGLYFPVSWHYNFILSEFENGNSAEITLNQDLKIMPGGSLIVESGVTVSVQNIIVYGNDFLTSNTNVDAGGFSYTNLNSANKPESELIVNGTLIANGNLGGNVQTEELGAKLIVSGQVSASSLEVNGSAYTNDYPYQITAQGNIYNSDLRDLAVTTYYSIPENGGYSWVAHDNSFAINYVLNNNAAVNKPENLSSFTPESNFELQELEVANELTFGGWFTDAGFTNQILIIDSSAMQYVADNTLTLYAKWSKANIITFAGENITLTGYKAFADEDGFFNPYDDSNATINTVINLLKQFDNQTDKDYYWDGNWYLDEECTNIISKDGYTFDSNITIYAGWANKYDIVYKTVNSSGVLESDTPIYIKPGTAYTLKTTQSNFTIERDTYNTDYTFENNWQVQGSINETVQANADLDLAKYDVNTTINITPIYSTSDYYIITITISNGTVTIEEFNNGNAITSNATYKLLTSSNTITITNYTYTEDNSQSATIDGKNIVKNQPYTIMKHTTINISSESCLVEGTLITLADGTQKKVEDLVVGDMIMVFNHITGMYEAAPLIFNSHATEPEPKEYKILNLKFANGKDLKIVASHGLFDMTLNKYVYITYDNYQDYIGHDFYALNNDGISGASVKLTEAYITNEVTRVFCPVTYFHMNSFANGFLNTPNIPGNITGLVNYFEYGEGLKYDEEQMQADIEKYGLYTYEDFKDYISYEAYLSSPAVYLKVSVGKGMMTFEDILDVINYLLEGSLIS